MGLRKLEQSEWKSYFDSLSRSLKSSLLNLEILGTEFGDQSSIDWQPLKGLSHDPRSNRFNIYTEHLNHSIFHPKDIFVQEDSGRPESIEIIDNEDNKQIIRFREVAKMNSSS